MINPVIVQGNKFIETLLTELGIPLGICGDVDFTAPIAGVIGMRIHVWVTEEAFLAACRSMLQSPHEVAAQPAPPTEAR